MDDLIVFLQLGFPLQPANDVETDSAPVATPEKVSTAQHAHAKQRMAGAEAQLKPNM